MRLQFIYDVNRNIFFSNIIIDITSSIMDFILCIIGLFAESFSVSVLQAKALSHLMQG